KHICNSHKPTHRPKIAKELPLFATEKLFFKIAFPSKIFKTADTQTDTTYISLTTRPTERQHLTAVWRNGGGRSSYEN
ncbi:MAG: hypothetical protein ACKOX3_05320, partial [Bacteroidota bacterium]